MKRIPTALTIALLVVMTILLPDCIWKHRVKNYLEPFGSVNGLTPGLSTLSMALKLLGEPDKIEVTPREYVAGLEYGGNTIVKYQKRGIYLVIGSEEVNDADPVIDCIYVESPYKGKTPQGIHIGMAKAAALELLNKDYILGDDYGSSMDFNAYRDSKQDFQVWFENDVLIRMKVFPKK